MSEEGAKSLCFECKRPLVEIDKRGHRLHGCVTCNKWWSVTGGGAGEGLLALGFRATKRDWGGIAYGKDLSQVSTSLFT